MNFGKDRINGIDPQMIKAQRYSVMPFVAAIGFILACLFFIYIGYRLFDLAVWIIGAVL